MQPAADDGNAMTFTRCHGGGDFTGTLGDDQVTLHNTFEGVKNSPFARGNFVVSADTSQNSDIHGEGHFRGTLTGGVEGGGSSTVGYTMHWNVSTHTEEPEARDTDTDTD